MIFISLCVIVFSFFFVFSCYAIVPFRAIDDGQLSLLERNCTIISSFIGLKTSSIYIEANNVNGPLLNRWKWNAINSKTSTHSLYHLWGAWRERIFSFFFSLFCSILFSNVDVNAIKWNKMKRNGRRKYNNLVGITFKGTEERQKYEKREKEKKNGGNERTTEIKRGKRIGLKNNKRFLFFRMNYMNQWKAHRKRVNERKKEKHIE